MMIRLRKKSDNEKISRSRKRVLSHPSSHISQYRYIIASSTGVRLIFTLISQKRNEDWGMVNSESHNRRYRNLIQKSRGLNY